MRNEFEEAFLKRYTAVAATATPAAAAASSSSPDKKKVAKKDPCFLQMRCCTNPSVAIQWKQEGEVKTFRVGDDSIAGELRRSVSDRIVKWFVYLFATSPGQDNNDTPKRVTAVGINGSLVQLPPDNNKAPSAAVRVAPRDVVGDTASITLWMVEAGHSYAEDVATGLMMPTVISVSPFVVEEAAANREFFGVVEEKIVALRRRLLIFAEQGKVSTVTKNPFQSNTTDPPLISLVHEVDWCLNAIDAMEKALTTPLKRDSKEVQTTRVVNAMWDTTNTFSPPSGYFDRSSNARFACSMGEGSATSPANDRSWGPTDTQWASVQHHLWVAQQQIQTLSDALNIPEAIPRQMAHLLHANAELERRLNQRQLRMVEMQSELAVLREATQPDHDRCTAAIDTIREILIRRHGRPPVDHEEMALWPAFTSLLTHVERLEGSLRASQLASAHGIRHCYHGGDSVTGLEQINRQLREEIAALKSEGGVEAVVALQRALGDVMQRIRTMGVSPMSAWA